MHLFCVRVNMLYCLIFFFQCWSWLHLTAMRSCDKGEGLRRFGYLFNWVLIKTFVCSCDCERMLESGNEFPHLYCAPYEARSHPYEQLPVQHRLDFAIHKCSHPILPAGLRFICEQLCNLWDLGEPGELSLRLLTVQSPSPSKQQDDTCKLLSIYHDASNSETWTLCVFFEAVWLRDLSRLQTMDLKVYSFAVIASSISILETFASRRLYTKLMLWQISQAWQFFSCRSCIWKAYATCLSSTSSCTAYLRLWAYL